MLLFFTIIDILFKDIKSKDDYMSREINMTNGRPAKLMLKFAAPLILANLGQQVYMIIDAAIVGRGVGVKALAAVGCTDWITWMMIFSISSLTQGFATFVSRCYGEKDYKQMSKTIAASFTLTVIIGLFLTLMGIVFSSSLLELLKTPADVFKESYVYLITLLSGTVVISAYNMSASILRAFGDGKTPLIAMIVAAVLNVFLDIVFVMVFGWGVFGAAIASVVSQIVSFLYCLYRIFRIEVIKIERSYLKPDRALWTDLLKFSFPLAIQYIIISLGGMLVQSTVNTRGSIFVAGYTATNKLYGLIECTAISLGFAITTYMAQNFGAGNIKRVREGLKSATMITIAISLVVMTVVLVSRKYLLMLFIDSAEIGADKSLVIANRFLVIMLLSLIILYLIYVYRCTLQAIGNSFWSLVSGIGECAVRIIMAKLIIMVTGYEILYYIEPAAWLGALLLVIFPCLYHIKKLN